MPTITSVVNAFDIDPELLGDYAEENGDALRARGRVGVATFAPGAVDFESLPADGIGYLIVSGYLCRETTLMGRTSVELLGPGDVLRPWEDSQADAPVPVLARHRAVGPVDLALLNERFVEKVAPWPAVIETLSSRIVERTRRLGVQAAVVQLTRIEDRLLLLFWHLADTWGRVERDGTIVCPVKLTHALLAGMVAARRPSVTTALNQLATRGRVTKHPDGWALHGPPPTSAQLEGEALADAFRLRRDD